MEKNKQSRVLPAPYPIFSLRGHRSAVNCVAFGNHPESGLLSGDVEGNVISWDLKSKRYTSMFQAHQRSVTTVQTLDDSYFMT